MSPPLSPPRRGTDTVADECSLPLLGGSGVGPVHGESLLGLTTVHWDHEPNGIPLNRPSGTFSPMGEKDGMRGSGSWKGLVRAWKAPARMARIAALTGNSALDTRRP